LAGKFVGLEFSGKDGSASRAALARRSARGSEPVLRCARVRRGRSFGVRRSADQLVPASPKRAAISPTSRPAALQRIPKETRAVSVRLADVTASSAQVGRPEGERGIFLRSAASAEAGRGSAPGRDSCGRSGFLGRSARPPGDPTPVQPGAPKSPPKVPRSRRHDACVRGSFAQRGRDPSPTSGVMSGRGSCRQLFREACVARPVDVEGASWGLNPDTRYGTRPDGYLPVIARGLATYGA
jgi:hypothetical protein